MILFSHYLHIKSTLNSNGQPSTSVKDCSKIIKNSRKVLSDAIKKGGSSVKDFKNVSGKKGSFQKNFKVYERKDLKCKRTECSGTIQRKTISNRSTFFCD